MQAGIVTVLNSRCSVLAAANPVFGRYDDEKTLDEQVDFQTTILVCIYLLDIYIYFFNIVLYILLYILLYTSIYFYMLYTSICFCIFNILI